MKEKKISVCQILVLTTIENRSISYFSKTFLALLTLTVLQFFPTAITIFLNICI